ncbi:MAG TPA: ABC transporter permease [Acidimicrobiales bacterium]|jgi:peptide/nickel transport system permease protein|nr:ABC transporter permease [Acidimicrobiales bacterium]
MLPGEIVEELDLPGGPTPVATLPEAAVQAPRRRRLSGIRLIAAAWLVLVVVLCALAPVLPLPDPEAGQGAIAASPGSGHILGTDQLGRDILSRILWGGRTSFFVAALTTGIAMFLGLAFGIIAGYFRGRIDWVIAGVADFVLAFPALILLIVLTSVFGLSIRNLVLGLSILGTPAFVRIARAHAMTVSQREFVLAARGSGARNGRIMVRHILPSVVGPVAAYALTFAAVVFVAEGSLSFLGLGVPPPTPSWGGMIAAGRPWLDRALHIVLVPSIVLIATVLALNFLGDRQEQPGRRR